MNVRALFIAGGILLMSSEVFGTSIELSLAEKVRYCAVVAEVRIDAVQSRRDEALRLDELVCQCTILQGFKVPSDTNKLNLVFHYQQKKQVLRWEDVLNFRI
jgi:hypothetical protein